MKRFFLAGLALVCLVALASLSVVPGKVRGWQQKQLVAAAGSFLRNGDLRSAELSARQVLQRDPANLSCCQILAEIAEREQSPAAILWRQKLADLQPGQDAPLLALAGTSIKFGETAIAEAAFSRMSLAGRTTQRFHETAASLALAVNHPGVAEREFLAALELDPQSERLRLNLASLRLTSSDEDATTEARASLEKLAHSSLRKEALRALLADARRRGDSAAALALAVELKSSPGAILDDFLLYLEELRHSGSPAFVENLHALETSAAGSGAAGYVLMTWMTAHRLASEAIDWASRLPSAERSTVAVQLATADAQMALGHWEEIRKVVAGGEWGDLEFLRCAMHARVFDETMAHVRGPEFHLKWERAVTGTRGDINALSMLARLVEGWGWKTEAVRVWWLVANQEAGQRTALKALYRICNEEKDARGLYRVARRICEVEPLNPAAQNNSAMLALLLGEDRENSCRIAAENFRRFPNDPRIVSTYAFSLHVLNRSQQAVELMARLPGNSLQSASMSACYGILLAGAGDREKASGLLERALAQRGQLLDEEALLVDQALSRGL